MTQARKLVSNTTEDLREIRQALLADPYTKAFRNGRAPIEALVPFIGHEYHILNAFTGSGKQLLERMDDRLVSDFVRDLLSQDENIRKNLLAMAKQIGMTEADLQAYEPTAEGLSFGLYLNQLLSRGTPAEAMCATLVNLPVYASNCDQLGRSLRETYGWPEKATAFVDTFASMPALDKELLPIVQDGLDRGEDPKRLARAARLIQTYEKMFWYAMAAEARRIANSGQKVVKLSA